MIKNLNKQQLEDIYWLVLVKFHKTIYKQILSYHIANIV